VIVGERSHGLLMVRQVDHQDQCALMAEAWGAPGWARPEPWGPVVAAAAIHDEGWRAWDDAPCVDARGAPIDFPDLDRAVHAPMYRRGIAAAREVGTRCGLLVSLHGQGLYEKRMGLDGTPPDRASRPALEREFVEEQERLQHRLASDLGDPPGLDAWSWAAYRLLQAWDMLSLYLCWRGLATGATWTLPQVPRAAGDPGVGLRVTPAGPLACAIDPWPFRDDAVELPVRAREIPARRYADDAGLRAALEAAPWTTVPLRAVRPPTGS
jgi:hypothetical protein